MSDHPINEKVDIYAVGSVAFEIATNTVTSVVSFALFIDFNSIHSKRNPQIPWANLQVVQIITSVVVDKKRPPIPSTVDAFLRTELMPQCWHASPNQRPSAIQLLAKIETRMADDDVCDGLLLSDVTISPSLLNNNASNWESIIPNGYRCLMNTSSFFLFFFLFSKSK